MPAPAPTPTGVVRIAHNIAGRVFRSEYSYTGSTPTVADLNTLAGAAEAAFSAHLAGLLSASYAMEATTVLDLANPGNPAGENGTVVAGTRTGTPVPANVAALLNFSVSRRYRGSKPKAWLFFGVESDLNNATAWTSAFTAAVNSAWAGYIAAFNPLTIGGITVGGQVAVSYYSGKTANPNPNSRSRFVPTPRGTPLVMQVESANCRLALGSQRRRI